MTNLIKNRLKELRTRKKITQDELALVINNKLKDGEKPISKMTISNWENNKHSIKPDKAQILSDYFGVSVGHLLGYKDDSEMKSIENLKEIISRKRLEEEKIEQSYSVIEEYLDNKKLFTSLINRLISTPDLVYPIAGLVHTDEEYRTELTKLLVNYLILDDTDKKIAFDLIQKLSDRNID